MVLWYGKTVKKHLILSTKTRVTCPLNSVCVCVFVFIGVSRRMPLILDVSPDSIDYFKLYEKPSWKSFFPELSARRETAVNYDEFAVLGMYRCQLFTLKTETFHLKFCTVAIYLKGSKIWSFWPIFYFYFVEQENNSIFKGFKTFLSRIFHMPL